MRNRIIYIVLAIAALAVIVYSPLTSYLLKDFITYKLEKALEMDIVFGSVKAKPPAQLRVTDIKAMDKTGLALTSERAYLRLEPGKLFKAQFVLNCDFQNIAVKSGLGASLNKVLKPFGVPAQPSFKFDRITCKIRAEDGELFITDLDGSGQDFRFSGNLARLKESKVDYELEFYINRKVVDESAEAQKGLLTDDDGDGWYTIKLSLKGDPKKPSSVYFSTGGLKLEIKPGEQDPKK